MRKLDKYELEYASMMLGYKPTTLLLWQGKGKLPKMLTAKQAASLWDTLVMMIDDPIAETIAPTPASLEGISWDKFEGLLSIWYEKSPAESEREVIRYTTGGIPYQVSIKQLYQEYLDKKKFFLDTMQKMKKVKHHGTAIVDIDRALEQLESECVEVPQRRPRNLYRGSATRPVGLAGPKTQPPRRLEA